MFSCEIKSVSEKKNIFIIFKIVFERCFNSSSKKDDYNELTLIALTMFVACVVIKSLMNKIQLFPKAILLVCIVNSPFLGIESKTVFERIQDETPKRMYFFFQLTNFF